MTLKTFSGVATKAKTTGSVSAGALVIPVDNVTGWPSSGPFVAVLDPNTTTEEWVLCDSKTGTTQLNVNAAGRGYVGTAQSHGTNANVWHAVDVNVIVEANRLANLQTAKGDLVAFDGSTTQRLAVGANGLFLAGDSGDSHGISYQFGRIPKFTNLAAIVAGFTTPSPAEGDLAAATSEDRLYQYDGATWRRIASYSAAGRTGGRWRRVANQSMPNTFTTSLSPDTEDQDSDNFGATGNTVITIPAGMDGVYLVMCHMVSGTTVSNSTRLSFKYNGNQINEDTSVSPNASALQMSMTRQLAAADTLEFQFTNNTGGAVNVTGTIEVWRVLV
jgi:hypothetical protein